MKMKPKRVIINLCRYNQHVARIDALDGLRHARNYLETRRKAFRVLLRSRARYREVGQQQTLGKTRLAYFGYIVNSLVRLYSIDKR